jgi:hypothetical protein
VTQVTRRALCSPMRNSGSRLAPPEGARTGLVRGARRRRDSHVAAAIDLLAATPLFSATTLAGALDVAVKTATPFWLTGCSASGSPLRSPGDRSGGCSG